MSAAARGGLRGPHARGAFSAPLMAPAWARLTAFAPLAACCALMWSRVQEPARPGRMLAVAAIAVATGAALLLVSRRLRPVVAIAAVAASLVATGVPARLLWPPAWDELVAGLAAGAGDLPGASVPYRGGDPWIATVLLLLGAMLAVLAAWLAFAPRRGGGRRGPAPAALALAVLVAVPAVQSRDGHPWLEGAALAVLLCAYLRLERVERHGARTAAALVAVAGIAAALAAPRLDAARPILDPQAIARSLGPAGGLTFSWNHSYEGLRWPRTGREVLRIRAKTASYWKAENLARFDGLRWVEPREIGSTAQEAASPGGDPSWRATIHVRVRAMATRLFVGAGTTLAISGSPRETIRNAAGTFRTGPRGLRRGHAYDAEVWVPRPTRHQLRAAGGEAPGWTWPYLRMDLPAAQGGPVIPPPRSSALRTPEVAQIAFPDFHDPAAPTVQPSRPGRPPLDARPILERSAYGGVYRLARRLRAGATTPYGYVERVLDLLADGYAYSETPRAARVPLADFLLRGRAGYCQQFSGAMALLLRMGGVPARVAVGFSPGRLDREAGEYIVRDTDAHSWVEAYIAPYGWVTFDPTPPAGLARVDLTAAGPASAYAFAATAGVASERVSDRATTGYDAGGGAPVLALALTAAAVLAGAAAAALAFRRRTRRRDALDPADVAIAELRAALAGTGRAPAPDVTLHALLRRFGGTPAEPYLRTLEAARFGGADVEPTPEMRAALRRELTLGLGPSARLGAWRAIPPGPLRHGRRRRAYAGRP